MSAKASPITLTDTLVLVSEDGVVIFSDSCILWMLSLFDFSETELLFLLSLNQSTR